MCFDGKFMASLISFPGRSVSKCLSDQLKKQNSAINEMGIIDTKHIRKLQSLIRDHGVFNRNLGIATYRLSIINLELAIR